MKSFVLWLLKKLTAKDQVDVLQYLLDVAMNKNTDLRIEIKLNERSSLDKMTAFAGSRRME